MKLKKKTEGEKWNEFTHGAWWLPFPIEKKVKLKKLKRKKNHTYSKLRYCDKCDKVYEVNEIARPKKIFYFSNIPKNQYRSICGICEGKKYKQINY